MYTYHVDYIQSKNEHQITINWPQKVHISSTLPLDLECEWLTVKQVQ